MVATAEKVVEQPLLTCLGWGWVVMVGPEEEPIWRRAQPTLLTPPTPL